MAPVLRRRVIDALGTLVVATCLLTACGSQEAGGSTVGPKEGDTSLADSLNTSTETAGLPEPGAVLLEKYGPSPSSSYFLSNSEIDTIVHASDVLMESCMTEKGFEYDAPYSVNGMPELVSGLGLTDAARAKVLGYAVLPDPGAKTREDVPVFSGDPDDPMAPYWKAYDECLVTSDEKIDPAQDAPMDALNDEEINLGGFSLAEVAPEVVAAREAFFACLAEAGFDVNVIPPLVYEAKGPRDVEQAVADVACKESSGLVEAYVPALYAAQKEIIAKRQADFEAIGSWNDERMRLAAEVLAGAQ